MIDTLLFAISIFILLCIIFYKVAKPRSLSLRNTIYIIVVNLSVIIFLIINTGFEKFSSDISRLIQNSRPKTPEEIYSVIFKLPKDSCVSILNIEDQVFPNTDCCIWMEIQICNTKFKKILNSKKYQSTIFHSRDSTLHLKDFNDRPDWWDLQVSGDSISKSTIQLSERNWQTLFFGKDSSQIYICDQAL